MLQLIQVTLEDYNCGLFIDDLFSAFPAKVSFYKTGNDKDGNKKGLSGALFHLYRSVEKDGTTEWESAGTKTSEENGLVEFGGLTVGDYYIVEDRAPEGYTVTLDGNEPKRYTFSVTNDDNGATVQISGAEAYGDNGIAINNAQAKGTVSLFKAGSDSANTGLNGAKFALYKEGADNPTVVFGEVETGYSYQVDEAGSTAGEQGYVTVPDALDMVTFLSSRGCLSISRVGLENSGSSSRNRIPLCASEISPGLGLVPPPDSPTLVIV